jgi:hypothetical protein
MINKDLAPAEVPTHQAVIQKLRPVWHWSLPFVPFVGSALVFKMLPSETLSQVCWIAVWHSVAHLEACGTQSGAKCLRDMVKVYGRARASNRVVQQILHLIPEPFLSPLRELATGGFTRLRKCIPSSRCGIYLTSYIISKIDRYIISLWRL